jgi:hypothetical protein
MLSASSAMETDFWRRPVRYTSEIKLWISTGVAATETSEDGLFLDVACLLESIYIEVIDRSIRFYAHITGIGLPELLVDH